MGSGVEIREPSSKRVPTAFPGSPLKLHGTPARLTLLRSGKTGNQGVCLGWSKLGDSPVSFLLLSFLPPSLLPPFPSSLPPFLLLFLLLYLSSFKGSQLALVDPSSFYPRVSHLFCHTGDKSSCQEPPRLHGSRLRSCYTELQPSGGGGDKVHSPGAGCGFASCCHVWLYCGALVTTRNTWPAFYFSSQLQEVKHEGRKQEDK